MRGGLGIYIHIPFCKQACHYCDFHFSTSMAKKDAMVLALQKELELRKNEFGSEIVETIYFGGGTPSVLTSQEIDRLIRTVYDNYQVSQTPEITLEANPDDLVSVRAQSRTIFADYIDSGINRLSIGIQSFFDDDLKLMNRAHNAREAENCISEASKKFENISIDLIYGIPGMDDKRWKKNIDKALTYGIPHVSSYALTVEPRTALAHMVKKGEVADVDEEDAGRQFYMLVDIMQANGLINYEISNFGKEGFFSKNNSAYWQGKKYLGIGPSAHSFDGARRSWNVSNNSKYLKGIDEGRLLIESEMLTTTDRYNEYIMTGLRTIWGVSLQKIASAYGAVYSNYLTKQCREYVNQGLLTFDDDILKVTKKGKFLVDGIAADLFFLEKK
ncbi:radical SAM family heme chaperone HemW [Maribacter algicola]|uniref:Radical SAM family heme chaperone HemW n=1 Tax=Meishania litoralis TaxID=3434685 RepID=A0ACC7LLP6_9FLAO